MNQLYKEIPSSEKPLNSDAYFVKTDYGDDILIWNGRDWITAAGNNMTKHVTHYLIALTPIPGLTDGDIEDWAHELFLKFCETGVSIQETQTYGQALSTGAKYARDKMETLLQQERDKQGELIEWISRMDISQSNDGRWYKNNPAFRDKPYAETTGELLLIFTQENKK